MLGLYILYTDQIYCIKKILTKFMSKLNKQKFLADQN